MERSVITWSVENWITVTLMAVVGFAALTLITQGVRMVLPADNG
jgi:hypothetical protein